MRPNNRLTQLRKVVSEQQPNQKPQTRQTYQPQNQQQISQNQLPRPLYPSIDSVTAHTRFSLKQNIASFPPADSLFTCDNTHDAGPNFIRPTTGCLSAIPNKYCFPLGAWIMPFGSESVGRVKCNAPFRCLRCKAYINPYFKMETATVVCNICGHRFSTEKLEPSISNSTEVFTMGVVDFQISDPLYFKKQVDQVKILLAIELTKSTLDSTVFASVIQSVKSTIQSGEFGSAVRFGIVTYGPSTTFYKVKSTEQEPIEYSVSDPLDPLCPLSEKQLYFDVSDERQRLLLTYLLEKIQIRAQQLKSTFSSPNIVAVINCLSTAFGNHSGRIVLFSIHNKPVSMPGRLKQRQKQEIKYPMKPLNEEYKDLAKNLVKSKIGVDRFIFGNSLAVEHQLATTHFLSTMTGGNIYHYFQFIPEINGEHLYYSIYKNLTRQCAYDVDFTCRVSNGLSIMNYVIGDSIRDQRDINMSIFDNSQSVSVGFQQQDKLQDSAYLQFAIMYTNTRGQRLIRIINFRFLVVDKLDIIHQGADYLCVANFILKKYVNELIKIDANKVLDEMIQFIATMLIQYRNQKGDIKYSELQIHPNLRTFLVYIYSVVTSCLFTNLNRRITDHRILQIIKINSLGFYAFANRYYPKLYPADLSIYDNGLQPGDLIAETDIAIIPPNLPLCKNSFKNDGAYILDDADYIYVFVMPDAPEQLLMELLGVATLNQIQSYQFPELETSHNIRITYIINELRRRNQSLYQPVLVIAPRNNLFDERLNYASKEQHRERLYISFLKTIHARVQSTK